MCQCILSIFQYTCISNKMQSYTVYLYLKNALHVLGGTSTHNLERIQLYLQHLEFVTPLLLSAAIVEELEPEHTQTSSNSSTTAADSSNVVTTDAVDTVVCAPNDGRKYHPKHVEQFPDINKRCNVAACWIYILGYC
jgi:hypothetical protein